MPYPPFAEIETNYTAFQQGQGDNSFPGQEVDTDLANLVEAVDTLNTFVRGFTRSDGEIGNQTIGHDQLKSELSIGIAPPSAWVTATAYEAGDTVFEGLSYYRATADHTSSGSFATDLAAGLWELLIDLSEALDDELVDLVTPIVEDLVPGITEDVLAQVPALVAPQIDTAIDAAIGGTFVVPAQFGAVGDFVFSTRVGTDDTAALTDAMDYASANGIPLRITGYHKFVGQYNVPSTGLTLIGNGRDTCGIMFQLDNTESGLCTLYDNLIVRDMEIQTFLTEAKDVASGHLGIAIRVGNYLSGVVDSVANFELTGLKVSRAQTIGGSTAYSTGGIGIFNDAHNGRVEDIITAGTFSTAIQCHWSGDFSELGDTITETGHPHDITFRNLRYDGDTVALALSAAYNIDVDHVYGEGVTKGLYFLPGDETNDFAPFPGSVCRNINLRGLTFVDCQAGDQFIDIAMVGTSRFRDEGGEDLKRTIGVGITIDGLDIEAEETFATGLRIFSGESGGSIEVKNARIVGFTESVRLTRSICKTDIHLSFADGMVYAQNSDNFTFSGVIERPEALIDDSSGSFGSVGIQMVGATDSTTLSGNTLAGATSITLATGLTWDILPGDVLTVGNEITTATRHIESGLLTVPVLALAKAHSNTNPVVLDMRARNANINAVTYGGRTGIYASGVGFNLDGPGPQRAGRYGVYLSGSTRMMATGAVVRGTGRARTVSPAYTCYDFVVDPGARAVCIGGTFGEDMENITGVFDINTSGTHGAVRIFGGRVLAGSTDNVDGTSMFFATTTTDHVVSGCYDTLGDAWP